MLLQKSVLRSQHVNHDDTQMQIVTVDSSFIPIHYTETFVYKGNFWNYQIDLKNNGRKMIVIILV